MEITEGQYQFMREYYALLEAIEEGMELMDLSYQRRNFGNGDKMFIDVISAFIPLHASNMSLRNEFADDSKLVEKLNTFQLISDQVNHLNTINDEAEKISFIHEYLTPSYKRWKISMCTHLNKYLLH